MGPWSVWDPVSMGPWSVWDPGHLKVHIFFCECCFESMQFCARTTFVCHLSVSFMLVCWLVCVRMPLVLAQASCLAQHNTELLKIII